MKQLNLDSDKLTTIRRTHLYEYE